MEVGNSICPTIPFLCLSSFYGDRAPKQSPRSGAILGLVISLYELLWLSLYAALDRQC